MLINRDKLKGLMREHHITYDGMAKLLGISRTSVCNKLTGNFEFSENEVKILQTKFGKDIFSCK